MTEILIDGGDLAEILTFLDSWPNGIEEIRLRYGSEDYLTFRWDDEADRYFLVGAE